jgi:histidinol-phosphate aminotransferase
MSPRVRQCVQAMAAYVPGEQPREPGLIKLNTNENPYPPSPRVAEALAGFAADSLRLYPDPACGALRDRIAAIHGCGPQQVFVGNGSDEILALSTRAFVEDDEAIGYFEPSYSLYPILARIRDVRTAPVALGDRFEWRTPPAGGSALFFLANPNAPTGMLHPRREVESFCRGYRGTVLIDEAYVDFSRAHCLDLALGGASALVMRSLSKSFSLAGLRVGYAVGPEPLVAALTKIKDSYNLDALSQRLALAALSDLEHMRRNAARIRATRERLAAALASAGFEVFPSETNFLWVRPPRLPAEELFAALRARRILVRHFPGPRTGAYLRITIGTDPDIDALIEAVGATDAPKRAGAARRTRAPATPGG